ncbi:11189_t:CDS:10 [Entrophospora sp. SA101]|nr:11189_t:CDS:10 [Entrophospora sp. SA101]
MLQQVVSYVAGTSVLRQYELGEQIASAGLWKIYSENPLRKVTDKRESDRASQLSRLRHPSILEVVEAVEESRTVITFATEPIIASLSNLLGNYDNLSPIPDDIRKFEMDELEIQKGLLQIGKGLQFCHNDAKIVHSNLVPEAIFVNVKGDWKIGGFGFSVYLNNIENSSVYDYPDFDSRIPAYAQKNYDFMAPEYALDENVDFANDMFALGCLIYTVHNHGKGPLQHHNSMNTFRKNAEQISSLNYNQLPPHLHEVMFHLITRYPSQRMNATEFQSSKYFDNILVSTVKFFESFPEKSNDDKANFMKGLIRILPQFPERVLLRKILPCLIQELKDQNLLPFILPNIFFISQKIQLDDFYEKILKPLKPVFAISEPMQSMIICLDKIDLFKSKTSTSIFKEDVMPLIYFALEAKSPAIQEKALRVVPNVLDRLDITTVKSSLFPRIQNLFVHTTILAVKVTTLTCLQTLIKSLDNFTMTEKLMPLLRGIKTKEPSVMVNTLAVYEEMGKNMEKDVLATEIIPHLWKLSIFQKFMKVIKGLSQKVENLHSRQLQDIRSIEDNSKKHLEGGKGTNDEKSVPVDFEKLVGSTGSGDINNNYSSAGGNIGSIEISPDPFDKPGANSVPIFISSLASSNKLLNKIKPPHSSSSIINSIPSIPPPKNSTPIILSNYNLGNNSTTLNSFGSLNNLYNSTTPSLNNNNINKPPSEFKFNAGKILQPTVIQSNSSTNNSNSNGQKIDKDLTIQKSSSL